MRDGGYYENFGGDSARGDWRSNSSGIRELRQASRFAWWRPPFPRYAHGVRPPFFVGRRLPLLPTPPPGFRVPRPPNFAYIQSWQSSQPEQYLSTYYEDGSVSAVQPHRSRERWTGECNDANVTRGDESSSFAKTGGEETSREHRTLVPTPRPHDGSPEHFETRVVADPRRRRSPKWYCDRDRPCDDLNASGASDGLRDCREPRKRSSSPATSERDSATSGLPRRSPSTSRSREWTEETNGARKETSRDNTERRSPPARRRSCTPPPKHVSKATVHTSIESESGCDGTKRRHDRSTSCDARRNSKRHKPGCRAGKFRSRSEERSSSASSIPSRQIKRSGGATATDTDSSKRKSRASGVVKSGSTRKSVVTSRPSVAKAATRAKLHRRDHSTKAAFEDLISPEIAKYKIPKLSAKEQRSSAQVKGADDVSSVRQQPSSSGSATKKLLAALRATSELRIEPAADASPQSSGVVAESPCSFDSTDSESTDLNPESPDPALLADEERSPDPDEVVAPSVAIADSTTSPNSRKAFNEDSVGEDSCGDVASDVTAPVEPDGLPPGPPSPEALQATAEHTPSPAVAAFEEIGEDESCDDASDGTESLIAYDAETLACGPRLVTHSETDEVSKTSPAESIQPESTLRSPSEKGDATVGEPLERPLVCGCDLHIQSDQSAELCQDDMLSDATEVYEYDQSSSSSEVEREVEDDMTVEEPSRSRSLSSSSATEFSDVLIVSEENSEEDARPEVAAANSSVSEARDRSDEPAGGIIRQTALPAASAPPSTDVSAVADRSRSSDSFPTSNLERVTISSPASAKAAGVNADAAESDTPVRESVRRGATVTAHTSPAVSAAGTSGSPCSKTSCVPATVPTRSVTENVASEGSPSRNASRERPALVHCAVRMPPGAPTLRVPMYEVNTAQSSEAAAVCRRFPAVDGPDGRRGALFELMTVSSLYVLNLIEDYATRDLVIRLYLEGRHSDAMESYGARIRALVQAAVERQRDVWKDLIGVLRRLTRIEWLFPQQGSCDGARIRELCELEHSYSQL